MQRLVTICLVEGTHDDVCEHLADDLAAGWRIVSVTGVGCGNGSPQTIGWLAVVLEKGDA